MPSKSLTHSNGTIIQGGFVSGMLDASMSQFIMYKSNGKNLELFKSNLLWSFVFPISVGITLPSATIANPRPVPGPIIKSIYW